MRRIWILCNYRKLPRRYRRRNRVVVRTLLLNIMNTGTSSFKVNLGCDSSKKRWAMHERMYRWISKLFQDWRIVFFSVITLPEWPAHWTSSVFLHIWHIVIRLLEILFYFLHHLETLCWFAFILSAEDQMHDDVQWLHYCIDLDFFPTRVFYVNINIIVYRF